MTQFSLKLILPRPEIMGQIPNEERESFLREYSRNGFNDLIPLLTECGLSLVSIQTMERSACVTGSKAACERFRQVIETQVPGQIILNTD